MSEHPHRGPSQAGKHGGSPGISPSEFHELRAKVLDLEKQLSEALSEKNRWNEGLRKWQEQKSVVQFKLLNGDLVNGVIVWVDRYTIGVEEHNRESPTIVHKGAIATIKTRSE